MHDLVIRNGLVVDGTGQKAFEADIAIDRDRIVYVGKAAGEGMEEIDAKGMIVAPGWVDIHTHFDAQATWDPILAPSSWHGVTTAIMGNCGVGFAPVAADRRDELVRVMEGVEAIPGAALYQALPWNWETFPEYLDALSSMPRTLDIGTHVPHSAVRAYVERDGSSDSTTLGEEKVAAIAKIVEEGLRAGALGVSVNRNPGHLDIDGKTIPGTFADFNELLAMGKAIQKVGHGIFEVAGDPFELKEEWRWMRDLSIKTGVTMSCELIQFDARKDEWREILRLTDEANAAGAKIWVQVTVRTIGSMMSWRSGYHPFRTRASWKALDGKSWEEQKAALKDPAFKSRLLAEPVERPGRRNNPTTDMTLTGWSNLFPAGEGHDYEAGPEASVAGISASQGRDPAEVAYDALMANDGDGFLRLAMFNYSDGDLEAVREMLEHPATVVSLSDAGAHIVTSHDATCPTFLLTHWARDRHRGSGTVALETAVRWQTMDTATLYGLNDRGQLKPGYLADINVIDLDRLGCGPLMMIDDLPAGCDRLIQGAVGYTATIKSGLVTFREGEPTGARPGGVIRGPQSAPVEMEFAE